MFGKHSTSHYVQVLDGIGMKTLCLGEAMLMTEFLLEKGSILPVHAHPYEQTGYLVKGKIRLFIGDSSRELVPGDSWSIVRDQPHHADILEDSVAIEVFHPVREEYRQFLSAADIEE